MDLSYKYKGQGRFAVPNTCLSSIIDPCMAMRKQFCQGDSLFAILSFSNLPRKEVNRRRRRIILVISSTIVECIFDTMVVRCGFQSNLKMMMLLLLLIRTADTMTRQTFAQLMNFTFESISCCSCSCLVLGLII